MLMTYKMHPAEKVEKKAEELNVNVQVFLSLMPVDDVLV